MINSFRRHLTPGPSLIFVNKACIYGWWGPWQWWRSILWRSSLVDIGRCCLTPRWFGGGGRCLTHKNGCTGNRIPCASWGDIVFSGRHSRCDIWLPTRVLWVDERYFTDNCTMGGYKGEANVAVMYPFKGNQWKPRLPSGDDRCRKYQCIPVSLTDLGGTGMRSHQWCRRLRLKLKFWTIYHSAECWDDQAIP